MPPLSQIKLIASRTRATIVEDAVGGLALVIMLVVSLHLPTFI